MVFGDEAGPHAADVVVLRDIEVLAVGLDGQVAAAPCSIQGRHPRGLDSEAYAALCFSKLSEVVSYFNFRKCLMLPLLAF